MQVYAVKDTRTDEFITNQNGRFLYVRKNDARIIKGQHDKSISNRRNPNYVSHYVVVEATVGPFTELE